MDKIIDEPSGVRGADQFVGLYPPSLRSFTYKFAWYYGDPQEYSGRLVGKTVGASRTVVGFVEIIVDDAVLLVINGAELKGIGTVTGVPHSRLARMRHLQQINAR